MAAKLFDINSIEPYVLTANDRDLIDKAIAPLGKSGIAKQGDGSGVIVGWASVNEEGKVYQSPALYCYAGMANPGTVKDPKFIAACMMHDGGAGPAQEDRIAYIDYIINRSPYSIAFVAQDKMLPDDVKGGVYGYNVCRTDVPANLLVGGLTAIRMAWEYKGDVAQIWHTLVKHGCDEDVAYAYAFQVTTVGHKTINMAAKGEGHSSWDGKQFTKEMLSNFLNRKMVTAAGSLYDQAKRGNVNYRPLCTAWGMGAAGTIYYGGETLSYLAGERIGVLKAALNEKDEKVSANVFAPKKVKEAPIDRFCEVWAGVLMEKCADLLAERDKMRAVA